MKQLIPQLTNKEILDLITENAWIASDHHFGHNNITKWEPLRGARAKELGYAHYEDMIVQQHNKLVKEDDIVILLGDYAFKGIPNYIKALNGIKILILGNHDRKGHQTYKDVNVVRGLLIDYGEYCVELHQDDGLFSGVIKYFDDKPVMLSHYSLFNDDEYDHQNELIPKRMKVLEDMYESFGCELNIHGHLHSKTSGFEDAKTVCLEHLDFKPVKIGSILND